MTTKGPRKTKVARAAPASRKSSGRRAPPRTPRRRAAGRGRAPGLDLAFAVTAMKARVIGGRVPAARRPITGVAHDSRSVRPGELFVAIAGQRSDGFDFCADAARAGAAALVVARRRGLPAGVGRTPVLAVDDPVRALGRLAYAHRRRFPGTVIGVTGSNGKTTTKELIAAALAPHGKVLHTPGNLNTEIGLPQTICAARGDERFWVLEMAMRGRGQIDELVRIAEPDLALVTNVGPAHLELLGSLEAIGRAKGEIYGRLGRRGVAIAPLGEPRLAGSLAHLAPRQVLRFGAGAPGAYADEARMPPPVRLLDCVPERSGGTVCRVSAGEHPVLLRLPLAGRHNALNACAALAVVHALGLPLAPSVAALADVRLPEHRSELRPVAGRLVLDDCYNANPASMKAALLALMEVAVAGRGLAILGDMLELGAGSAEFHRALGREAAACGVHALAAVGAQAGHVVQGAREGGLPAERLLATDDARAAARWIASRSQPRDAILIKASRGVRLEVALAELQAALGGAPEPTNA